MSSVFLGERLLAPGVSGVGSVHAVGVGRDHAVGVGKDDDEIGTDMSWKSASPLDDDVDAAAAKFIETGELPSLGAASKAAVQTYAAVAATAACSAVVGPASPVCGFVASEIAGAAYEFASDAVEWVGDIFSKDPPPPSLIELPDVAADCVTLMKRWDQVGHMYFAAVDKLITLYHQSGLKGTYDWITVTKVFSHLYDLPLSIETGQAMKPWGNQDRRNGLLPKKPSGVKSNAVWRRIPNDWPCMPPPLYVHFGERATVLCPDQFGADGSGGPLNRADKRAVWTSGNCKRCMNGKAKRWLAKFLAAVVKETARIETLKAAEKAVKKVEKGGAGGSTAPKVRPPGLPTAPKPAPRPPSLPTAPKAPPAPKLPTPPAPKAPPPKTPSPPKAPSPAPSTAGARSYPPYPPNMRGALAEGLEAPRGGHGVHPGHGHHTVPISPHGGFQRRWGARGLPPWRPDVVVHTGACKVWGDRIELPHAMQTAAKMALGASNWKPTAARGPDGVTYLFAVESGEITARPCTAMG